MSHLFSIKKQGCNALVLIPDSVLCIYRMDGIVQWMIVKKYIMRCEREGKMNGWYDSTRGEIWLQNRGNMTPQEWILLHNFMKINPSTRTIHTNFTKLINNSVVDSVNMQKFEPFIAVFYPSHLLFRWPKVEDVQINFLFYPIYDYFWITI